MAIARLPLIAIDCPDPGALATFYGAMLAFHRVADYTPPNSGGVPTA
ncbi:MAG TPA: hypothetical protein VFG35_12070 [Actinoplanes sp.]|nr:hypothetical protein [Actinoplanes sp.]